MAISVNSVIVELEAKVAEHNRKIDQAAGVFDKAEKRKVAASARSEKAINDSLNRQSKSVSAIAANYDRLGARGSAALGLVRGAAVGLVASLGVGAISNAIRVGLDYAASIGEAAQAAGVATDFFQEFRFAATQGGLSVEGADISLRKYSDTLGEALSGSKSAAKAFADLNIPLEVLRNAGDAERFELIAEGISKIPEPAQRAAAANEIFGKSGALLLPVLEAGAKGFRDQAQAAREYGIVLSNEQIQSADKTADKIAALQNSLSAGIAGAVANNAEAIGTLANSLIGLATSAIQAFNAFGRFKSLGFGGLGAPDIKGLLSTGQGRSDLIGTFQANIDRARAQINARKSAAKARGGNLSQDDGRKIFAGEAFIARQENARNRIRQLDLDRETLPPVNLSKSVGSGGVGSAPKATGSRQDASPPKAIGNDADAALPKLELLSNALEELAAQRSSAASQKSDAFSIFGIDPQGDLDEIIGAIDRASDARLEAADAEIEKRLEGERVIADVRRDQEEFLAGVFIDLLDGGTKRVFQNLKREVFAILAQLAAQQLISAFGGGSSASSGGGFGSLIGSIFGGARATGGPVSPGKTFLVGERGPELFQPSQSGNIIPNNKLSSVGGTSTLRVVLSGDIDARIDGRAAGIAIEVVREASPKIMNDTAKMTMEALSRTRQNG